MLVHAARSRHAGTKLLRRCLATESVTPSEPSSVPPLSKPASTQWKRPLAPGVLKAYDEALALLKKDSNLKTRELQQAQKRLRDGKAEEGTEERIRKLEIESQINLPEVRWNFKQGTVDMSQPVYRHLLEQRWRKDGELDLLMERIHQMKVLPDVLSSIHPTGSLRVFLDRKTWGKGTSSVDVEPGVFVPSRKTKAQPRIQATVFHPETKLYTLMIVDLDVPDTSNQSFQNYLHLLQTNIPLSATTSYLQDISLDAAPVAYQPPHPQKGTPYHRYVTLLLPQEGELAISAGDIPSRAGFDVRDFAAKHRLGYFTPGEGVSAKMVPETYQKKIGEGMGGAIHMWRAIWDEDVSGIYKDILNLPEPTFGLPPKPDRYGGIRASRYYGELAASD